jgi:hypothetical protein
VFIMTTIRTQRPTVVYVACFYPDLTAFTGLLLSRHSQQLLEWFRLPIRHRQITYSGRPRPA